MGLTKRDRKVYLKVADGKFRIKCSKDDPEAEERFVELTNSYVYEKVYTKCEGMLINISQQEHEEYGISFSFDIYDPESKETFSVQMPENSRYFAAIVQVLPNVDFSKPIVLKPYSFKNEGGQQIGMTLYQDGEKVENWYKSWDEKNGSKPIKGRGLEKFDFEKVKNNKSEIKILRIRVLEFLKEELKKQVKRLLVYKEDSSSNETETASTEAEEPEEVKPTKKKNHRKKPF